MKFIKLGKSAFVAGLPIIAACLAVPVNAQPRDLDPEAVAAATRYALPLAFDGYRTACAAEISSDGYVAQNSERLAAKFEEGSEQAWPAAKNLLVSMAAEDGGDMVAFFGAMPDETLKPFVDGIIEVMIAQEIKTENCSDIERGLELLDPMPVENMAGLIGFFIDMDNRDKAKRRAARAAEASGQ